MSSSATVEDLRQEIEFRDKIIRKLELRVLDKEEEIQQLRSDLDKVNIKRLLNLRLASGRRRLTSGQMKSNGN